MVKKNTFSNLASLRDISIAPGAVFLGPWADIDHEKFLVVAGVSDDIKPPLYSPEKTEL